MKLRNVVGVALGTVGLSALANRAIAARAGEFEPVLSGRTETYRWRGFDVAYTEAGDPDDTDMVLLHGINAAASSHEYEAVFNELAADYHVIAPDLPGFGHSDRPPLIYSASLYTTFVRDFLDDMADKPVVTAASLSGAYAAKAAETTDVSELLLVCPTDTTFGGDGRVWIRSLLRSPLFGQTLYNLVVSKPSLKRNQADHGYYDVDNYDDETMRYEWQTAHQSGARYAPASFVSGHLDPDYDLADTLTGLDVPITLVWGRDAPITPLSEGREIAERADARLVSIDESKLIPHVEHAEEFLDVVSEHVGWA
jgi:pimeloyl-ACP methyl ester carboxylesterase